MSVLLVNGNALSIPLADGSVQCVVTSPPYWGLRDYGIGDQLGLERTPEEYVANMVAVFREVKRVLRDDGTLWLNLGDSYANTGCNSGNVGGFTGERIRAGKKGIMDSRPRDIPYGLKPKDLVGIPWRVAFALQADGWYLRSDIIWSKPNPMPESVTDRPTKAHEYVFLLSKQARYFYDIHATREEASYDSRTDTVMKGSTKYANGFVPESSAQTVHARGHERWPNSTEDGKRGRNRRTVWHIATAPYSGAHFATYPPALVEPCIKAGTSERGCCPECGKAWVRVVDVDYYQHRRRGDWEKRLQETNGENRSPGMSKYGVATKQTTTLGFRPACDCIVIDPMTEMSAIPDPIPCTVFDPFAGSGTTLLVARKLGRHGVGLDLSYTYLHDQARKRLDLDALDEWQEGIKVEDNGYHGLPLFEETESL